MVKKINFLRWYVLGNAKNILIMMPDLFPYVFAADPTALPQRLPQDLKTGWRQSLDKIPNVE